MTSHNNRYTSHALTHKVFANMRRVGKGFSGVETPLFAFMLVQPQPQAEEEVEVPIAPSPPALQNPTPTLYAKEASQKARKENEIKVFRVQKAEKGGKIEAIDADEGITLVDVETDKEVVAMDAETQGRLNQEDVSVAKPTVFDDEEVIMTMAQAFIKLKAEKAKLLDEQIAQRLHDEEVQKATAKGKQEKADMQRALELQKQYDDKEEILIGVLLLTKKNMKKYLKNMVGYKMEFFRGMTYDRVRPIFEREYKKVQTLFKQDKDVQEPKTKKVADETLLQEKPSEDKEKALWVELKRLFEPDAEDVLWKLQRYMHAPLTWKLYINCGVHHVSSTRRHDIFMLTEKDYPLSNVVMILMLSGKLQVEEDNEMARDLVMKIFMEANKPKSKSLDTSSK
nr:hypothetical protein [Tanacetum cinerariifolium]